MTRPPEPSPMVVVVKKCRCCGLQLTAITQRCPLCESREFVPIPRQQVPAHDSGKP